MMKSSAPFTLQLARLLAASRQTNRIGRLPATVKVLGSSQAERRDTRSVYGA
jgi:hypothetical protein